MREYEGVEIVVEWEPSLCIHSAHCISSLPGVFDTRKRPWVTIGGAAEHEIARVVEGCPSGALRVRPA